MWGADVRTAIITYLPWLLSAMTIYSAWLAGGFHRHAWTVSLANQLFWLVWIIAAQAWGLLPMNAALWIVFTRNHLKWQASRP